MLRKGYRVILKRYPDKQSLASAAADRAANIILNCIAVRGKARIIAATGASQFEFLDALTKVPKIDWVRVEMFHLDEYIGVPETHPASFCKYLHERLIDKVGIGQYHLLSGTADPAAVMQDVGNKLQQASIDVAFVGVGENGHLALTTHQRISRPKNLMSSLRSTNHAADSSLTRGGSRLW